MTWRDHANCRGVDTMLFFPSTGSSSRDARDVCSGCVVRRACYEHALAEEHHGIWGGTSERERKRARSQRARRVSISPRTQRRTA